MTKNFFLLYTYLFLTLSVCSQSDESVRIHPIDSKIVNPEEVFYSRILPSLKGKKVMLVTNPSGIGINPEKIRKEFNSNNVTISHLIGLEHGFLGIEEEFSKSPVTIDSIFGLPIYHIYKLSTADLNTIVGETDVIVFDVQGVGMRCYTYLTVLKRLMDASLKKKINFYVLDHVSPSIHLGGRGDFVEKKYLNFAGEFPSPVFTGLTLGEAANFYNAEFLNQSIKLEVVPVSGYKRGQSMESVGVPWHTPSPNLPLLENARNYFSLVFLEGVNVSVGRGTQAPFVYFGAPWMTDPSKLAEEMDKNSNKDYYFTVVYFKPTFGPHTGKICKGLRLNLINVKYDPIKLAYNLISSMKKIYPKEFKWTRWSTVYSIDYLWGNTKFRDSIDKSIEYDSFNLTYKSKEEEYNQKIKKYWLYK
ncbi:exo-beta-N-acetylmuramidase NamZ family protein [Leptospira sp. GIMC2001]|uniref:exo-beta-N-acetylmuramidase NamZ family protein n=1 Tax=Leptospira sp. GIMC2001 TaxID=1513297 RepID=UPI002349162A|nr:DUF1343 domain-containing protein [Leptospira sp. GIMC2001]WCL50493.1 DUF1343 domain-containing protein [Leptospira sp. GIMC2001]